MSLRRILNNNIVRTFTTKATNLTSSDFKQKDNAHESAYFTQQDHENLLKLSKKLQLSIEASNDIASAAVQQSYKAPLTEVDNKQLLENDKKDVFNLLFKSGLKPITDELVEKLVAWKNKK